MRPDRHQKKKLYRKVNTRARGVWHNQGPHYRHLRNTKAEAQSEAAEAPRGKMRQGVERGLDYTPLYRFLLSKVGQPWDAIHSEALPRLDKEEPLWHIVARDRESARAIHGAGESSYYAGLYIDAEGHLQITEPSLSIADLWPLCPCCTHTFNGQVFPNRYDENRRELWHPPEGPQQEGGCP